MNNERLTKRRGERMIVGVMSGTSVDGIDAAVVRVMRRGTRYGMQVLRHAEVEWPRDLRRRLLRVMAPAQTTTQEICELNVAVAETFLLAAIEAVGSSDLRGKGIDAIASHGQTVCHLPRSRDNKRVYPSTLQLGDPSVIATLAGVPVVGNFRPADMVMGGEGAPLVPFADDMVLSDRKKIRCVQNIGGIANVTYLPTLGDADRRILAFDTGPGNMVMDAVVAAATQGRQRFDRGGRLAKRGTLNAQLFRELQAHRYFDRRPPKSTGREEFGAAFAENVLTGAKRRGLTVQDIVHTLARWTAWSIADAYLQFLPVMPDEVILCGGGADNPLLVEMLAEELGGLTSEQAGAAAPALRRIDDFGIPNKAKEAASFAVLGAATLDGVAGNVPSVTGAARGVVLGVVAPGTTTHRP